MVKNLEAYRNGKEPRIIVPERAPGATVTLRNNTGGPIDGLVLRLESPSPRHLKSKPEGSKAQGKEDLFDEDEDDEGDAPRPARTLATEIWFQGQAYIKGNHAASMNDSITEGSTGSLTLRKPEVAIQFSPLEHGETLDLDVTLLTPQALDREAEFTVIPTRKRNVIVEADAPSPLRNRITAYIAIFLIGEVLMVVPFLTPQMASLLSLAFLLAGVNIIVLASVAVILDKTLPKPRALGGMPHLIILASTVLTIVVILGAVKLTDIVITQLLLVYAIIVTVYFASVAVKEYFRTRRETRKPPSG